MILTATLAMIATGLLIPLASLALVAVYFLQG